MTGRAIDVEALLASRQHLHGDRERHQVSFLAVNQAGVEKAVFAQLAASHGVRNLGPDGAAICEEGCAPLGNEFGLVLHILAAAGACKSDQTYGEQTRNRAGLGAGLRTGLGYQLNTPPPPPKPARS